MLLSPSPLTTLGRSQYTSFLTQIAPDDFSANILIYGGFSQQSGRAWEETYVLSLPSFRWINVTDTSAANKDIRLNKGLVGRRGHTCKMYNNRQFISLGGDVVFGQTPVNPSSCNDSWPSIRVFDASTLTWLDQFQPSLGEYQVPDKVSHVIGGRLVYPSRLWAQVKLTDDSGHGGASRFADGEQPAG